MSNDRIRVRRRCSLEIVLIAAGVPRHIRPGSRVHLDPSSTSLPRSRYK